MHNERTALTLYYWYKCYKENYQGGSEEHMKAVVCGSFYVRVMQVKIMES